MPGMQEAPTSPPTQPEGNRRRGPLLLMVLGAVLLVAGTSGFVVGSVLLGNRVADSASGLLDLHSKVVLEVQVPGRGEAALETGDYQVVAYGPQLVHRVPGDDGASGEGDRGGLEAQTFAQPAVTVTGPDGRRLAVENAGSTSLSTNLSLDSAGGAVVIAKLSVSEPGRYQVAVRPGDPVVTSIGIRPSPDIGETFGDAIGSGLIVIGGVVAGGLGLLVLVGGIVWYGTGDRRQPEPLPPPPGYGPLG
jgi:hypothetical protein